MRFARSILSALILVSATGAFAAGFVAVGTAPQWELYSVRGVLLGRYATFDECKLAAAARSIQTIYICKASGTVSVTPAPTKSAVSLWKAPTTTADGIHS